MVKNLPILDKGYQPMVRVVKDFMARGKHPVAFVVERNDGYNYRFDINITDDIEESFEVVERLVKTVLWLVGGYKVYFGGSKELFAKLRDCYSKSGARAFDADFMARVYEKPFEVVYCEVMALPMEKSCSLKVGGNLKGCRIGFDAGGSDRKVSAVVDGVAVYSEEVVWHPKTNEDPTYHYDGIVTAFKTAASKMPRVDAIGVSSAGIYVANRIMVASLFLKVPLDKFDKEVKDMYMRAAKEIGNVPLEVANDGDVTALAGAMELRDNCVLGIAMGTSEAAGYINSNGGLNGWLSELAFVPCDFNKAAMVDEWSGDYGCGVKYFSQDGVIKLAAMAGVDLSGYTTPAEKLKAVQKLVDGGSKEALQIFKDIGVYLGHAIAYYAMFYDIRHMLLLGRVTSGEGGNEVLANAKRVIAEEYPHLNGINITMPDESNRRVGQSIAAASLPK